SMGVDTLELDMGVTKDGVVIVSHERGLDPDLARTADGSYVPGPGIPFVKLTLAEVKRYDVGQIRPGSAYAARFPDQLAVPGTRNSDGLLDAGAGTGCQCLSRQALTMDSGFRSAQVRPLGPACRQGRGR